MGWTRGEIWGGYAEGMDKPAGVLVEASRVEFLQIPPENILRDSILCPEHVRALESQLKDFR
jgi:hypothetical protein